MAYTRIQLFEMEETLNRITQLIDFYRVEGTNMKDVERLIQARIKISGHAFTLAGWHAELASDYDGAYFARKVHFAKLVDQYKEREHTAGNKCTDKAAENWAIQKIGEWKKTELDLKRAAEKAKLLLRQVNETLSTLNQHISFLKEEQKHSKKDV